MGCDIHIFAEIRKGDKWEKVGDVFPCTDWAGKPTGKFTDEPYDGRNYTLFALLAGVRNRERNIKPIKQCPYSIPPDASEGVIKERDYWQGDGHSHSWYTLKELLDYDWSQGYTESGIVATSVAEEYRKTGKKPESWCQGTNAKDVERLEWPESYSEMCDNFITQTIPALQALGSPEDVRIVFWFDN